MYLKITALVGLLGLTILGWSLYSVADGVADEPVMPLAGETVTLNVQNMT